MWCNPYVSAADLIPVAAFSATPTTGTAPHTITFIDASSNFPTAWSWTFGDGSISTEQNPTHTYTDAGIYTVSLTATNAAGSDTATTTDYITISKVALPIASFTADSNSGTAPLTVTFTDTSTNSPSKWVWTFGDDSYSTVENPTHSYTTAGTYTVTLTVTNSGGSNTITKTAFITVDAEQVPVASFTVDTTSGITPLAVAFTDTSTYTPTAWSWTFGDGSISTEQNPTHTYTDAGTYTVTLLVTNGAGTDTITKTAFITVDAEQVPVASFTVDTTSGITPLAVAFTDTSTYTPTAWLWTFGDGSISTEQNPTHTYTDAGTYTVTLVVTNAEGSDTITTSDCIIATSEPVASFTSDVTTGSVPLTVAFTDTSTNVSTSWKWTFGDGYVSTLENPTHTYTNTGYYTVTLTVSNSAGSDTIVESQFITATAVEVTVTSTTSPTTPVTPRTTIPESALTIATADQLSGDSSLLLYVISGGIALVIISIAIIFFTKRNRRRLRRWEL
ncbi:MAG: PKD domain-containing protein [Methanoregula sp.]